MSTFFYTKWPVILKGFGAVMVTLAMLGVMYMPSPYMTRQAEALTTVIDPANLGENKLQLVQNTLQAVWAKVSAWTAEVMKQKELTLDGIAFTAMNMVIQQVTKSIVTWINSGFQGSPTFLRDFDKLLVGVADRVAGDFIWGTELDFLCSPFKLDVRLALDIQYKMGRDYKTQCTISGIVENVEDFMNGDFLAGGWDGWYSMTMNPQNNFHGATLNALPKLSARIVNAQGQELKRLDWGKGFLSSQECHRVDTRQICRTVTPGSVIQEQLNGALGLKGQRLLVADEINEIVGTLFAHFAREAIGGVGGLLGLTGNNDEGVDANSYYDELAREGRQGTLIPPGQNPIKNSLLVAERYLETQETILAMIQEAADYKNDTYGESNRCHSGEFGSKLRGELEAVFTSVVGASTVVTKLQGLNARFDASTSSLNAAELQSEIMQEYTDLLVARALKSEAEVIIVETVDIPRIEEAILEFKMEIDTARVSTEQGVVQAPNYA